jgi:hypothetical protein
MPFSNQSLLLIGSYLWVDSYKDQTIPDYEAIPLIHDSMVQVEDEPDESHLNVFLKTWAARWVDQGAPRLVVDDKFASLLMATNIGEGCSDLVIPPWKAFMIEVQNKLLCTTIEGKQTYIDRILVQRVERAKDSYAWNIFTLNPDTDMITSSLLVPVDKLCSTDWHDLEFEGKELHEDGPRVLTLVNRLVTSLCLALSDPTISREQKKTKGRGQKFRFNRGTPTIRTFIIGRPVTVDCRPAVREYLSDTKKKSSTLDVQSLVRGHWKNQAYGTKHSLRKLIHIEPYWKGPEDSQILLRPMIVKG